MKSIEIKFDENVICPFCQQITVNIKSDDAEVIPCKHLVYAATDVSLEFRSEIINRLFGLDPQEDNCELTLSDLTEHPDFEKIFNEGELKDLIQFESYEPAPSFMGAYFGFIQNQ